MIVLTGWLGDPRRDRRRAAARQPDRLALRRSSGCSGRRGARRRPRVARDERTPGCAADAASRGSSDGSGSPAFALMIVLLLRHPDRPRAVGRAGGRSLAVVAAAIGTLVVSRPRGRAAGERHRADRRRTRSASTGSATSRSWLGGRCWLDPLRCAVAAAASLVVALPARRRRRSGSSSSWSRCAASRSPSVVRCSAESPTGPRSSRSLGRRRARRAGRGRGRDPALPPLRRRPADLADAGLRPADACSSARRTSGSCSPGRRCSRRSPAAATSRSPPRRSSSRRSSCRCAVARAAPRRPALLPAPLRRRSARSTRSGRGCASRSSWTRSATDLQGVVRETMQPAHVSSGFAERDSVTVP